MQTMSPDMYKTSNNKKLRKGLFFLNLFLIKKIHKRQISKKLFLNPINVNAFSNFLA